MMRADMLKEHAADDGRPAWRRDEFEAQLRERGRSYHIHHPFNVMLNTGKATPEQIRGWVANRFAELLPLSRAAQQRLLEIDDPLARLEAIAPLIEVR